MAADWPTLAEVKTVLGITTDTRDTVITDALAAAVEQVCNDAGYSEVTVAIPGGAPAALGTLSEDEDPATVTPNYSLSQAALILAVMAVKAPDAPYGIAAVFDLGALRVAADHPTYQRMLVGSRQAFGFA